MGRNSQALGQKMSEDLGSRDKCPVYLPKIFSVVPDARGGLLSTICTFLAGETRRRAYSSETCLFRIRLQFAHIWTSLLPPHPPISLYLREHCQENKVPQDCFLIKG